MTSELNHRLTGSSAQLLVFGAGFYTKQWQAVQQHQTAGWVLKSPLMKMQTVIG